MDRKMTLLVGVALSLFANVGCCSWANRWCNNSQPAPAQYCAPPPQACYPAPQACYPAPPQQSFQRAPMCQ